MAHGHKAHHGGHGMGILGLFPIAVVMFVLWMIH